MSRGTLTPRALAYTVAASSFFLLGMVVYRDDPDSNPDGFTRLSEQAKVGRTHWLAQNCNACHQLYGFGGYLGPDLTHVARRVDQDMFRQIIREGSGQMPSGMLDTAEADAVYAFLSEMDRSGQGHLEGSEAPPTWERVFEAMHDTESKARGIAVFTTYGCGQCHQPFRLGHMASPDISRTFERKSQLDIDADLRRGRGNMPAFTSMTQADMASLLDLLEELTLHRAELSRRWPSRTPLPWFNYKRPEGP